MGDAFGAASCVLMEDLGAVLLWSSVAILLEPKTFPHLAPLHCGHRADLLGELRSCNEPRGKHRILCLVYDLRRLGAPHGETS